MLRHASILTIALALSFIALLILPPSTDAVSTTVVIGEFRTRGPNGGNDEFIELYNLSSSPVSIGGWRLRGSSATGSIGNRATITAGVTLQPGCHYLVTNSAGYSGAVAGDQSYTTGIADTGGIALAQPDGTIVDQVGLSNGSAFKEGAVLAALTTSADRSYERKPGGSAGSGVDTDVNSNDFELTSPSTPQSSSAACVTSGAPASTRIHDIQGKGHISPFVTGGQTQVTGIRGIVTLVRPKGFFMQDPATDNDDATSEALFVFTNAIPTVSVGDDVQVSGTVMEFRTGGVNSANLTSTQITSPSISVQSSGNPLPAAIVIGSGGRIPPATVIDDDANGDVEAGGTFDPGSDGIDFYESLESMRVQINNAVVTGPTGPAGIPVVGDNGSNANIVTPRGGVVVRANDFNPERIFLDSTFPSPKPNVGDKFTGAITGVIDYASSNFKLLTPQPLTLTSGGLAKESTDVADAGELAIATFNVENLSPNDPQTKFDTLADLIVNNLKAPDLIAVEEIQDNNGAQGGTSSNVVSAVQTFTKLIQAIQSANGPTYSFQNINPVAHQDGGEPGGNIRVGFLFRTDRGLSFTFLAGGGSTVNTTIVNEPTGPRLSSNPGRIQPTNAAFNGSRKPLVGEFMFNGQKLFVIANHFGSKGGDQPLFGRFQPPTLSSEVKRIQQAQIVNDFVDALLAADASANIIVLGDLNDFEFSTALTTLKGGVLNALIETLPAGERYTYVFDGNSQAIDHILLSANLFSKPFEFDVVHVNAEFEVQASDHDPQVVRIRL
ncbi:MAG TPA: lamin tail domain-containing protein [Pyrinomonadaceae bacterium]|nr:lamin tail domain-containing protein [Pyrinomonadaceae bacterium]